MVDYQSVGRFVPDSSTGGTLHRYRRGFKSRLGVNFLNSGPANSDLSPALLLK